MTGTLTFQYFKFSPLSLTVWNVSNGQIVTGKCDNLLIWTCGTNHSPVQIFVGFRLWRPCRRSPRDPSPVEQGSAQPGTESANIVLAATGGIAVHILLSVVIVRLSVARRTCAAMLRAVCSLSTGVMGGVSIVPQPRVQW